VSEPPAARALAWASAQILAGAFIFTVAGHRAGILPDPAPYVGVANTYVAAAAVSAASLAAIVTLFSAVGLALARYLRWRHAHWDGLEDYSPP